MSYFGKEPIALLSFGIRLFKCVSHDNESFKKTPRYLTLVVGLIF